jgi:hypothetical protein
MSRRTFPRATAAGLIAAALGTPSPAPAQAPNPWRGETAARPTAPAPRAVTPAPTRQLIIGLGFNSTAGLTGSIQVRDLTTRPPVAPAPRAMTAAPAVYAVVGACPVATTSTTQELPPGALKPIAAGTAPASSAGITYPPKPVATRAEKPFVVTVGYTQQLPAALPRFMPPPAPLPGQVQAPAANVLIPVEVQFLAPPKGVIPVWTPTTNAVPPIPPARR